MIFDICKSAQNFRKTFMTRLVIPLVICGFTITAADASDILVLQKQFSVVDSVFTHLVSLPESRMKEVPPFDAVSKKTVARNIAILCVMRTNSKGAVVNCVWRSRSSMGIHSDVSATEWYTQPQQNGNPYYGIISKDAKRVTATWSRPLYISTTAGGKRFAGVVAIVIDANVCFAKFASAMHSPFQIVRNNIVLYSHLWKNSWSYSDSPFSIADFFDGSLRMQAEKTAIAPAQKSPVVSPVLPDSNAKPLNANIDKKVKPVAAAIDTNLAPDDSLAVSAQAAITAKHAKTVTLLIIVGGIIVLLMIGIIIWFVLGNRKNKKNPWIPEDVQPAAETNRNEQIEEINIAKPESETEIQQDDNAVFEESENTKSQQINSDGNLLPAQSEELEIVSESPPTHAEEFSHETGLHEHVETASLTDDTSSLHVAPMTLSRMIAETEAEQLTNDTVQQESAEAGSVVPEQTSHEYVCKEESGKLSAEIRRQLIEKEMPKLIAEQRDLLTSEVKQNLLESSLAEIEEQERLGLQSEIAKKIRKDEYAALAEEARKELAESMRHNIAEREASRITARIIETLTAEIRAKIVEHETDSIRSRVLDEETNRIRDTIRHDEYDGIAQKQRERLERDIYEELSQKERSAIAESVVAKLTEEEHARITTDLRDAIIRDEKNRLVAEESPQLREDLACELREQEYANLKNTVRDEIYGETIYAIRSDVEEKYKVIVDEKIQELKASLQKKIKTDIKKDILAEYEQLAGFADHLSATMTNVEALESLSQTVTLLTDEKKKYKYLNLNATQTESLLEYLKRVQNRFNIYFDKVDESIRELMLKLGNMKNKLDS